MPVKRAIGQAAQRRGSHLCALTAGVELAAAQRSVACAADTVAQMVEYIRGSRVDDYAPLFDLNARLCAMDLRVSTIADGESCFDACSGVPVRERHLAVLALCIKARGAVLDAGYMVSQASQGSLPGRAMSLPMSTVWGGLRLLGVRRRRFSFCKLATRCAASDCRPGRCAWQGCGSQWRHGNYCSGGALLAPTAAAGPCPRGEPRPGACPALRLGCCLPKNELYRLIIDLP